MKRLEPQATARYTLLKEAEVDIRALEKVGINKKTQGKLRACIQRATLKKK